MLVPSSPSPLLGISGFVQALSALHVSTRTHIPPDISSWRGVMRTLWALWPPWYRTWMSILMHLSAGTSIQGDGREFGTSRRR